MATSHLARLREFGLGIQAGEPYRSLSDLLAYEEHLATLDLKVRVGADGSIRGFQILSVQQNEANPFVPSVARRWLTKLELFVRGFRFSDQEVIARLIDAVFDGVQDDMVPLVQLLGDLEFYLGALAMSLRQQAWRSVCRSWWIRAHREGFRGCSIRFCSRKTSRSFRATSTSTGTTRRFWSPAPIRVARHGSCKGWPWPSSWLNAGSSCRPALDASRSRRPWWSR
jgi:hypothetical protein